MSNLFKQFNKTNNMKTIYNILKNKKDNKEIIKKKIILNNMKINLKNNYKIKKKIIKRMKKS